MAVARVALDIPRPQLFDYAIESGGRAGCLVRVPVGKRTATGVIVEMAEASGVDPAQLRPVTQVLADRPLVPDEIIELARFASDYYRYPLGPVLLGARPGLLRRPILPRPPPPRVFRITDAGRDALAAAALARAPARRALLTALAAGSPISVAVLAATQKNCRSHLRILLRRGWVEGAHAMPAASRAIPPPELNDDQSAAVAALRENGGFTVNLLFGVTGSGKTEVFLRLMADTLENGRQALVLVPEIGLIPQLGERLTARFPGHRLAPLHSGLADHERLRNWLAAAAGDADIVLGTRLAVFAPLPRLGLIVVDEEQDASLRQQDGFRYSARDLAIIRGRSRAVPVLLASATPSLETLHNARSGRYRLVRLPRRANPRASLPTVTVVDMRIEPRGQPISRRLREAIEHRLARGEQSLVFINRRGYSPALACPACGRLFPCPRCSTHLVLHLADRRLRCHQCGLETHIPGQCPDCGNADLRPRGHGTQRIESLVAEAFPGARVARVDSDSTRRKGSLDQLRDAIDARRIDILVGTQMLAKGHDFPGITLVGVVGADGALLSPDFRALERLFGQLSQVAGRAGRADQPGEVIVQTAYPDHALFSFLVRHDTDGFADFLLAERAAAGFPPFGFQALLRAEAPQPNAVFEFLGRARELALPAAYGVSVFDPVPAPMERRAGILRGQLLVQSASRTSLKRFLDRWVPELWASAPRRVRWLVDVDPGEL